MPPSANTHKSHDASCFDDEAAANGSPFLHGFVGAVKGNFPLIFIGKRREFHSQIFPVGVHGYIYDIFGAV